MTEFEIGDKVRRSTDASASVVEVIGTHSAALWVQYDDGVRLTWRRAGVVKVEPRFETGKTYKNPGLAAVVTVTEVNDTGAIGWYDEESARPWARLHAARPQWAPVE